MSGSNWMFPARVRIWTWVSDQHDPPSGDCHMSSCTRQSVQPAEQLHLSAGNFMVSLDLVNYDGRTAFNVSRPVSHSGSSSGDATGTTRPPTADPHLPLRRPRSHQPLCSARS